MSNTTPRILSAIMAACLALTPVLADARVGGGSSMGSRGSQTFSPPPSTRTAPNTVAPMERTLAQPAPAPSPMPAPMPAPVPRPAMAPMGGGFMSGLMGGLIGAGIGGMLFGGGFMGHGLGFGGFIGFLLQMALVVMIGRFLWRRFMGPGGLATAAGPGLMARGPVAPGPMSPMGGGAPARGGPPPIQVSPQDFQTFEQLLYAMQAAWSAQDLNALRKMATPEMVSYFAEQLADQASRGVVNLVSAVRLESGDLSQAWAENGREYATVAMRFSMIDVTKDGAGRIVDGSPNERITATEVWTFVRAAGGQWILSAIQQAG